MCQGNISLPPSVYLSLSLYMGSAPGMMNPGLSHTKHARGAGRSLQFRILKIQTLSIPLPLSSETDCIEKIRAYVPFSLTNSMRVQFLFFLGFFLSSALRAFSESIICRDLAGLRGRWSKTQRRCPTRFPPPNISSMKTAQFVKGCIFFPFITRAQGIGVGKDTSHVLFPFAP